jgi:NAD(P)-dependent dehydrogenase (short-subunit alcohol dehydrogenase family)
VLVNNAGGYFFNRHLTEDGLELTYALNHLSYFLLTGLLLEPLLAAPAGRVVNVASAAHHNARRIAFEDLGRHCGYWGLGVYGESKLMNVLFTYELARRLEGRPLTANALHPGFVRTRLGRSGNGLIGRLLLPLVMGFGVSAEEGARTVLYLAASPEVEGVSGQYFAHGRTARSSPLSHDRALGARLWERSLADLSGSLDLGALYRPLAVT